MKNHALLKLAIVFVGFSVVPQESVAACCATVAKEVGPEILVIGEEVAKKAVGEFVSSALTKLQSQAPEIFNEFVLYCQSTSSQPLSEEALKVISEFKSAEALYQLVNANGAASDIVKTLVTTFVKPNSSASGTTLKVLTVAQAVAGGLAKVASSTVTASGGQA